MTNVDQFVERYVKTWNEPDPETRPRFSWEMTTAADGEVDSIGTQFLVLESDGRIRLDYQFIGRPPASDRRQRRHTQ